MNNNLYKTTISNIRWIAYDIPGNIGWITYIVCLIKGRKLSVIKRVSEIIPGGISQYLSVSNIRPEINAMVDRMKTGRRLIKEDGRIGMELLARKIDRMKDKMADPNNYYTFDLFEEFLFAKMLEAYVPEMFEGEERWADIMKEMPMFTKGSDEDMVQRMETDSTSEEELPFN